MDESEVDKIIKEFGKSRTLRSAVLKVERDKKVAVVCNPQAFSGSMFIERESQMAFLDKLLFQPRPSLILVREFSFLSIAFFASFHFSVFKSVQNWRSPRKIAVGKFSVSPDLNLYCLHHQNQLL